MKYKKLSVELDQSWVLEQKGADELPIDVIIKKIESYVGTESEVIGSSIAECEILVKSNNISEKKIIESVNKLLEEHFGLKEPDEVVQYSITDIAKPKADLEKDGKEQADKDENNKDTDTDTEDGGDETPEAEDESDGSGDVQEKTQDSKESAIDKIHALIAAQEFKNLADECRLVAPLIVKNDVKEAFTCRSYIFSINEGNGLSSCLNLFAELLEETGMFKINPKYPVKEIKIPAPSPSIQDCFYEVRKAIAGAHKEGGKVVCIDISEWMNKSGDAEFRELLKNIDDNTGRDIVIFRVPFVEKNILDEVSNNLADILLVKQVSFVPFSTEELLQYTKAKLSKSGFLLDKSAYPVFDAIVNEEKMDGRFYGLETADKIARKMIFEKSLSNAKSGSGDLTISEADIADLVAGSCDERSGEEMLDALIGMQTVKDKVREIVAQIETAIKHRDLSSPSIHMRFVGSPGTGKTTVARIVGKLLREKGILRNGDFFEYSGRDFCGQYVGQTAPRTASMCRDAYGSVLFIDEAYSLYRGDNDWDYGREALDMLISEMENHRNDFVVIMAGYTDEMETLMKGNAGLESRMPYLLDFPNYSRDELYEIFMDMVDNQFKYEKGFKKAVKNYFLDLSDEAISAKDFSNARFVRNLFERTWGKAVLRGQLSDCEKFTLKIVDFKAASVEREFSKIIGKKNSSIGFAFN